MHAPTWGVVLGPGHVARHAAKALSGREDVRMFAMPCASQITHKVAGVEPLKSNEIGACADAIKAAGVHAAAFVGRAHALERDGVSKAKGLSRGNFWNPYSKLMDLRERLDRREIELQSIVRLLPAMALEPGSTGGAVDLEAADGDLAAAIAASEAQKSHQQASQFFVVDRGQVLHVGRLHATDYEIQRAGQKWEHAHHPVLCRVASHHYGGLFPPVIGAQTARMCRKHGLRGLIVQGGVAVVMQPKTLLGLPESKGFFFAAL